MLNSIRYYIIPCWDFSSRPERSMYTYDYKKTRAVCMKRGNFQESGISKEHLWYCSRANSDINILKLGIFKTNLSNSLYPVSIWSRYIFSMTVNTFTIATFMRKIAISESVYKLISHGNYSVIVWWNAGPHLLVSSVIYSKVKTELHIK